MCLDRLINLYEHERMSPFDLRAKRLLILRGTLELPREEARMHVDAIGHVLKHTT